MKVINTASREAFLLSPGDKKEEVSALIGSLLKWIRQDLDAEEDNRIVYIVINNEGNEIDILQVVV